MHPSSGIHGPRLQPADEARTECGSFRSARLGVSALLCAVALFAAGCHNNNQTSGAGVAWITLTDQPGDFSSYIVNVDSITLTRSDGTPVGPLLGPETVDFTKLSDLSELWGSATIPIGTYTSASIVLDYTSVAEGGSSVIAVMVNGLPQKATVVDSAGKAVKVANGNVLQTVNVILDPAGQLIVPATYATTSAQRLAIDFNLAASTASVNMTTNPATVTVKPYLTVGVAASDQKLIRVRGPLINSSVSLGTYTVYVRPFLDEFDNFGSLSLFVDPSTIFTTNGVVATGTTGCAAAKDCGITQLSQSSAGTTVTAAYTTFEPTATPNATAGKFHAKYVIAGSTLEDPYTSGLEGDVISRTGNILKVRDSTLQVYTGGTTGTSFYGCSGCVNSADATVTLGPATRVTADDTTLANLDYNSVAVGQHVVVRGICNNYNACTGAINIDATSSTATNTGSVRLIPTHLWGSLLSSGAGALSMNLQTINNWPVSAFTFAGNGTSAATEPVATAFTVNTGALTNPVTTVADPLWIDGRVAPFGSAPPAFDATAISSEASVPASLQVQWKSTGTKTPFSVLSATVLTIDLANTSIGSAVIRVGPDSVALASLPASPQFTVVPQAGIASAVPGVFLFTPRFSYGVPTAAAPAGIHVFSAFKTFATDLPIALATTPALQLEAHGTYNRATNTFSASSVDVVL
ncbi:MAG TPA: hypothetical protein VN325_26265 [Steroidobacteraceae bacterium]|nr:hypothetical protein [Steroidobacteraceae bacterium]